MTYQPTVLGCFFLVVGAVFAGCEVWGVYEFVSHNKVSAYVWFGSCAAAAVMPILPALADWCSRGRRYSACVIAWIGFVACLLFVMGAAVHRTGAATDAAAEARLAAERAMHVAENTEKQAAKDYEAAQNAALAECTVRRQRCMDAEAKASALRAELARARAALVRAPAGPQIDPLASRLAGLPGMSEELVRLLQPLQLPFILSLVSVLFFSQWAQRDFRAALDAPAAPTPQVPGVPKSAPAAKSGAVPAFLVARTEAVANSAVEIEGDLYNAYVAWCQQNSFAAYAKNQFALELAAMRDKEAIDIEIRGEQAYCLNLRLAA